MNFTLLLLIASALLVLSIFASKISTRFGIPALLLFLALGMLAGSDGIGKLDFEDHLISQRIGIVALVIILFTGGMQAQWSKVRHAVKEGILLSTVGVAMSTILVALFTHYVLAMGWLEGLLVGAIISSTDAPAVFMALRSSKIRLEDGLAETVELESGSNDPMAVFLVITFIELMVNPEKGAIEFIPLFLLQMSVGLLGGIGLGYLLVYLVNSLRLSIEGLYPVMTIGIVFLGFSLVSFVEGSGFLSVYVAGLIFGSKRTYFKRTLSKFYDGIGWLVQIAMFLILGLLVFPSKMSDVVIEGLSLSFFLLLIARPLSVVFALLPSRFSFRQKLMISWMGLRGGVPIILATFPLTAFVPNASGFFHLVFFIVIISVLLQGTTIGKIAKYLKVINPNPGSRMELQYGNSINEHSEITEVIVPYSSQMVGKSIMQLDLPDDALVALISRADGTVTPTGRMQIEGGDVLMVVGTADTVKELSRRIAIPQKANNR